MFPRGEVQFLSRRQPYRHHSGLSFLTVNLPKRLSISKNPFESTIPCLFTISPYQVYDLIGEGIVSAWAVGRQ